MCLVSKKVYTAKNKIETVWWEVIEGVYYMAIEMPTICDTCGELECFSQMRICDHCKACHCESCDCLCPEGSEQCLHCRDMTLETCEKCDEPCCSLCKEFEHERYCDCECEEYEEEI